jgi:hypothetical protein
MQALQYTRALQRIVKEMKVDDLIQLLKPLLASGSSVQINPPLKDHFSILLFSSRAGYERLMEIEPTAKVLRSLRVGEIYEPGRLGRLVTLLSTVPSSGNLLASLTCPPKFSPAKT